MNIIIVNSHRSEDVLSFMRALKGGGEFLPCFSTGTEKRGAASSKRYLLLCHSFPMALLSSMAHAQSATEDFYLHFGALVVKAMNNERFLCLT